MNAIPKTEACIKMLSEAQMVFSPLLYRDISHFEKDRTLDFQNRIKAMFDYRLLPFGVITMPDNADKETAKANPVLKNINDFDAFWYAMNNYQLVTADDLSNEFWSICPDLESIPKFLDVLNVKFDDVNYRYDTDIKALKGQYECLNELAKAGTISEQDADEMLWNIHFLAKRYNFIMHYIGGIYGAFRKMVEPQPESNQQTKAERIQIPQKQLNALFEGLKGCITPYDKDCFIYAFNGGERPKEYNGMKKTRKITDAQFVYLIAELFSKSGITEWHVAYEFGIKNPEQKKVNYYSNKDGKPKGYIFIDDIVMAMKKEEKKEEL